MYSETKKLHLIEELLKVDSDTVLAELETVLAKSKGRLPRSQSYQDFKGTLSLEEVNELERIIEDGCEQINEDDWK
ncbi:hypothetical protein [Mucilaginibacter sp.]|uniref:hypothetical protein n=1 Tax=Mucilaginibacter sp. TaxID=1882438 RepID=UPI00262BAEF0|nr:hypothetical protein [Mucilaginibacter sp.]MDB4921929.1 hypothetical protein [Mucilaginibacter sp.]